MIPPGNPLLMFLQAFVSQAAGYFAVAGLLYFLVWKLGERRFQPRRIQEKKRFNRRQLTFEVKNTLVTLAMGTTTAIAISLLYAKGWTKLTTDPRTLGWPTIVGSFVLLLVLNDAWFYGWHRLFHHPKLFRYIHVVHHKSVDVNPFSSYSFHVLEGFILGAWVIPTVLCVPMYLPMLGVLQVVGLANNMMSHLGYEFLPSWLLRVPVLRWMNSATFHSMHHAEFHGNYSLMFRWLDRLFGTELRNYEQTFTERAGSLKATDEVEASAVSDGSLH